MDEIYINTSKGQKIAIRELQRKSLEIFDYFRNFCKTHSLKYFVIGGCAIGSIRHEGFIPWDDDIDVFMPRPDYEKLTRIWSNYADLKRFELCRSNDKINYHDCGMLLKDNNTTFINDHSKNEDINQGYFIDIIPLDGCPRSKIKQYIQIFFALIYSLFNAQRLPDNQGYFIRRLAKLILGIIKSSKARYKIWRFCEKQMTKYNYDSCDYVTELVTGLKYIKLKYDKKLFETTIEKKFENTVVELPIGYDQYLKMAFGNYMELPSLDARTPKHKPYFIDLNRPYKEYKGKYYCINNFEKRKQI